MSWFPEASTIHPAPDPTRGPAPPVVQGPSDRRSAPGEVRATRRETLWVGAATAAAFLLAPSLATAGTRLRRQAPEASPNDDRDLGFKELVDRLFPMARDLVAAEEPRERAYLQQVAALLSRLESPADLEPREVRAVMQHLRERRAPETEGRFPLTVVEFDIGPGGGFSPHDHRDYNGVILGIEGEARVRNFEILGDEAVPPKEKPFRIREMRDEIITPGRISTLGRRRDNIHELVAGEEGVRLLDIFTFFTEKAGSHYLELSEEPIDPKKGIYRARWS